MAMFAAIPCSSMQARHLLQTSMDSTIPNLDLQSTSPAKDQGGPLTTVAAGDAGTGTSLVVSDASYFQDGTFAPAGRIQADYIAVGTVSNTVQIASINYATNTITLANSISRSSGQSVWLYKKSDGARVLYGTAPDAGAYEIPQASSPLAPMPPLILGIYYRRCLETSRLNLLRTGRFHAFSLASCPFKWI